MVITVQITPDGKATEMTSEEADEQKGERIYSGASLNVPERWEHKKVQTDNDHARHLRLRR